MFSPSTGIFDSHSFMMALRDDFEERGGITLVGNKSLRVERNSFGFQIIVYDQNIKEEFIIETKFLINSAGIESISIANSIYEEEKFSRKLIKGEYYSYQGKEKLENLIYPIPQENSLGVHATLDMGKGIKFGPSAYEVKEIDYSISNLEKDNFYNSILSYWPSIKKEEISPGYSGIRAIVNGEEDFIIDINSFDENILVNVLGYVSPGLTSSLALAKYIENKVLDF